MTEQGVRRAPAALNVAVIGAVGFFLAALGVFSLPFWVGPLSQVVATALERVQEMPLAGAALNTVVAAVSAGAFGYLVWRLENDGLGQAIEATWKWRSIFAKGAPFALLFAVHCLVLAYRPTLASLEQLLIGAGGVPEPLVVTSALLLMLMWQAPAVGLFLFAVSCFLLQEKN